MAKYRPLLFLATVLNLTSGLPLNNQKVKRDSTSHQIVQIPGQSLMSNSPVSHSEATSIDKTYRPQAASSPDKVNLDYKGISYIALSKSKDLLKTTEQVKKRTTGEIKSSKKGKKSNVELLNHLGMTKLRSPSINHHRKRLASQSRKTHHQKSSSDSKMFVIKLPPNPYYYTHHDLNGFDVLEPQPKSVNNLPVNFKTNGKPSRVYHWNIPVLKKMVARKAGSTKTAVFADSEVFNIDKQKTWNETDDEKSMYRKATYYGPKKQSKNTFRKYFAGNGKPHSFYVMGKSQKPDSVHRLLP